MKKQDWIERMYASFNKRDVDGTVAFMSEDVSWPKASEGGRVVGKQAIGEYWARQWANFDAIVGPVEVLQQDDGRLKVKVHQLVRDHAGAVLSDSFVWHTYTLRNDLVERMEVSDEAGNAIERSAAFRNSDD